MPPPPVSGAAVGYAVFAGADVGVADAVCEFDGSTVVTPGLAAGEAVAVAVAEAEACDELDAETCDELDAGTAPRPVAGAVERPPGEAVRLADDVPEAPDTPVCGVGVKVDGDDPPEVQAETATATRTAPAAERAAVSHALGVAPGLVRRIFANPSSRMRVRYIGFSSKHASYREAILIIREEQLC